MKAITCSQCGALIKRISLKEKFAHCDYCGANIPLAENKEKIIDLPDRPAEAAKAAAPKFSRDEQNRMFVTMVEQNNDDTSYDDTRSTLGTLVTIGIVGFFVVVPIILAAFFNAGSSKQQSSRPVQAVKQTPVPEETPPVVFEPPVPVPDIKYRSYVQYNTNIGADLVELPVITLEQLPTTDHKELKKTVFAQRRVRVRITVDESGDVVNAAALNGHQVLRDSSVDAAKRSLFSPRKRKTTTVLTYIYVLED